MAQTQLPGSEQEIAEIIKAAYRTANAVEIIGGGTRLGFGNPVAAKTKIDMKNHAGITLYEPDALTLVANSGTTLEELQTQLKRHGQRLPFEPMSHSQLFGNVGKSTIGGVVSCNISGPRRIQAGACRDSLIGVRFINGEGEIIKNGGRVMKNVTGLDLVKLLCGSFGTLGVISQVAFKVLPINEREISLVIPGLDIGEAIGVLSHALATPFDITGAAHLPNPKGNSLTVMRIEGFSNQVEYRLSSLRDLVVKGHDTEILEGKNHDALWQRIRNVEDFKDSDQPVWKISSKPSQAPLIYQNIQEKMDAQFVFDWGGGLIWMQHNEDDASSANQVRNILKPLGAQATMVRAGETLRKSVPVFEPQQKRVEEISNSIRRKFDPSGILNPGRVTGMMS